MSKKILFKSIYALLLLAAAVLWLLSLTVEQFAFFNLSWAVALLSGGSAVAMLVQSFFVSSSVTVKKVYIFGAAALAVVCVFACVSAVSIPDKLIAPIIAVVVTAAIFLGVAVSGGKGWDHGDNKSAGYKNYYERKKDEEKQNKDK